MVNIKILKHHENLFKVTNEIKKYVKSTTIKSWKLMFCKNSHKYNVYLGCSAKICHEVAFNEIYNKQRIFQHP